MYTELGFVRIVTAVPETVVADVDHNVDSILALTDRLKHLKPDLVLFPELSLTAYTCADLFSHQSLLENAEKGLRKIIEQTSDSKSVYVVGTPLRQSSLLFNCAVAIQNGKVLGAVPKSVLPNYKEYYEKRWFAPAAAATDDKIKINDKYVPFGTDVIFLAEEDPAFSFAVELCEDLWTPVPASTRSALAGANILLNTSASNELVGKADYRRELVKQQSGRCLAAYAYCSAGVGESTTDLVFGGHCLIAENDKILEESQRYQHGEHYITADIDVNFLNHERSRYTTFRDAVEKTAAGNEGNKNDIRTVAFSAAARTGKPENLYRPLAALPFVPADPERRTERCQEVFAIQSNGLAKRMKHTGIYDLVIGLSGGLDSTHALLAAVEACNLLAVEHSHIHAITMPGFGTSDRTLNNVKKLCETLAVNLETIDIRKSCQEMYHDIGHDGETADVTFENVQARTRTAILMNKANLLGALVAGTGDLSELALGWCTYNGDHMSMYNVNCGVPKTLITFLVEHVAGEWADSKTAAILRDIVETPISPELVPPDKQGEISQRTEEDLGPYELHDFFLYNFVRNGFTAAKCQYLASQAFGETYDEEEIAKWLDLFISRFFTNQFKRSCLPDGPKVGTMALSPRGDWRMPSDASYKGFRLR